MINSDSRTFHYPDGNIQRVQRVSFDSWQDLEFLIPEYSQRSFQGLVGLYRDFFMPRLSLIEGRVVLFRVPEDLMLPVSFLRQEDEIFYDRTAALVSMFRKNVSFKRKKLSFSDRDTEEIYRQLKQRGCLYELDGKRSSIRFLPAGDTMGYLSENSINASLKLNASFFLFDRLDCPSVYDKIGIPFGLCVKNGKILLPPLFEREVLTVDKEGRVSVSRISLKEIGVEIDGRLYQDGSNSRFFSRPQRSKTPAGICDIVIEGNRVVAVRKGGRTTIPSAGFVIQTEHMINEIQNKKVLFHDLEDIAFAIQAGNSAIVNGRKTERFISPFYHFLRPWAVSFPPAMYPLNYKKDRAPRMVLGADKENRPVLLWLEGAGKFGHVKGEGSCGASLSETADICKKLGLYHAVHLDGGGSAQILINNQRQLMISDRDPENFQEKERAVAMGLYIK
ncbi:MAG: phosphodiester glycosidase family protein [Erysipelotrichaceae bacterium]|nr:phosphodiester glycosidase family protein [Erysipelotrichaceae bacterium]